MNETNQTTHSKKAELIIEAAENRASAARGNVDESLSNQERKVVRFSLSKEEYAIDAHFIHSFRDTEQDNLTIFPLPGVPDYIVGLINLRGEIISVINLKVFFSLPNENQGEITKIIIVECADMRVGFLVDSVHGIADFPLSDIKSSMSTIEKIKSDYLDGEYFQAEDSTNSNATVIGIIDIEAVLTAEMEQRLQPSAY